MIRTRRVLLSAALVAVAGLVATDHGTDGFSGGLESFMERSSPRQVADLGIEFGEATEVIYRDRQRTLAARFRSPEFRGSYRRHSLPEGEPFARLRIPRLGVELMVIEGVSGDAMRSGAGHYPETAYPGTDGNVGIAGHRTGFGAPFARLNELRRGDTAELETPEGRFIYQVVPPFDGHTNPWVTHPLDWTVIAPTKTPILTLTTEDPPNTSKNRLIVRFSLVRG